MMKRKYSDGQQFHQYKKKWTTTSHFKWLDTKKIMTYGSGTSGPGLVQAHKCGRAKTVNGTHTLFFDNWISNCNTDIWLKKIKLKPAQILSTHKDIHVLSHNRIRQ
jgi:hypothetical protein